MRHPMRTLLAVALAVFAGTVPVQGQSAPARASQQPTDHPRAAPVRAAFEGVRNTLPRGVALVVSDGVVVFETAHGLVDGSTGKPITVEHLFDLGSLSKHITAAAVLRLVDTRKLSLDDRLSKHFKVIPDEATTPTVRDLLAHTSGMPKSIELSSAADATRKAAVAEFAGKLGHAGSPFEYSNSGYEFAAALVEEVSGTRFEKFVQKELFQRAGLKSATLVGGQAPESSLVTLRVSAKMSSAIEAFPSGFGRKGATGVIMSAREFVLWDSALRAGKVLSQSSRDAWSEAGPGDYGLGWEVSSSEELGTRLHHEGSVEGYRSFASCWTKSGAVIVVLSDEQGDPRTVGKALEAALLPGAGATRTAGVKKERIDCAFFASLLDPIGDSWFTNSTKRWTWIAKPESNDGALHMFLRAERAGDSAVSVYGNVDLAVAKLWLRDLEAAALHLDSKAPRRHRITVHPDEPVQPGDLHGSAKRRGLVPFVDVTGDQEPFAVIGLRRAGESSALAIEMDRATLAEFAADLRTASGD